MSGWVEAAARRLPKAPRAAAAAAAPAAPTAGRRLTAPETVRRTDRPGADAGGTILPSPGLSPIPDARVNI